MGGQPYKNYYSWETPLSDQIIGHNNGAVSCIINWDGFNCELAENAAIKSSFSKIYEVLHELNCWAEWHWWRERDTSVATTYLDNNAHIKRGQELAGPVRKALADHLAQNARSNECALVLNLYPKKSLKGAFLKSASRADQIRGAKKLYKCAVGICRMLPGGAIGTIDEYFKRIAQSFWRRGYTKGLSLNPDLRYDLSEQLLPATPTLSDGFIEIQGYYSKVLLLYKYPDAMPGWFGPLADASCDMHAVQTVAPVNTRAYIDKQTEQTQDDNASLADRGVKYALKKIREREAFTSFVADNNLRIFKNCYLIHLHGEKEETARMAEKIETWANLNNGKVRMDDELQAHFFRVAQPGHGAVSGFFREDHTWQVGNMTPVMTFDPGIVGGESLRLSISGQLTGFSILKHKVSHGFTAAMTGGGKGVDKGCEIIETYPFGLDWYVAEAGGSYPWIIEGLGGTYVQYDPEQDVINPFPDFSLTNSEAALPVDASLCSATIGALAFLLTDGNVNLTVHQIAAAEKALQQIYKNPIEGKKSPRLDHFQQVLDQGKYENQEQKEAATIMASNLYSFLNTAVGERFKTDTNVNIHQGLFGIDLKKVTKTDRKLMEYCLTAIGLRYSQLAFYQSNVPSRVLLDELHEFVEVSPKVIGNLCRQISRMGRKEFAGMDIVTQGLEEIKALDSEVVGSTTLRNLLYRKSHWQEIGKELDLPDVAIKHWQSYAQPDNLNWRPGLRGVHDKYYNLYLTFPKIVLDLAGTDPIDIEFKQQIGRKVDDVFERLEMLEKMRHQN